ncbi:multiple epidermal growth factor-like domains protein 6 [Amphibalanus amphitrite]|uniref:multiple epidermal growth factor-like domains protein 6 n=1 Tax=Amphibalanus amphitrite TaxID=1232801 RepID=UPI001C9084D6|nr:multiple epidermal growth factor-like domains protein 6 [Amphibalanus amphitrite]
MGAIVSPAQLSSLATTLLLLVASTSGSLQGASSWRPYYGPYGGRPSHSYGRPHTSYGPPDSGHGLSNSLHGTHGVSTGYGPPKASSLHSSHSISGTFSRPMTLHGSHSVSASYSAPSGAHGGHGSGSSYGQGHRPTSSYGQSPGQGYGHQAQYQANPCATFISCEDDKGCPSGQYCSASPHLPQCGKECLPDLPNTYRCDRDYQCRSNYCDPNTHTCRLRPSPPDPCKGFMACQDDKQCPADRYCGESPHLPQCGHECLPDLPNTYTCERDYQCRSNYCNPNTYTCQLRPSPPDPCKGFMACQDDKQCPADRYCGESPYLPQCGHECLPDLPNTYQCDRDYQCRSNYCDLASGTCRDRPSPPDPCAGFLACQGDQSCSVVQHCAPSPLRPLCGSECVPDLPNGMNCERDQQCLSGYCHPDQYVCKPLCYGVNSCYSDSGCAYSEHCSPSKTNPQCGKECQPDYPDMTHPCDRDEQCQSGYCDPAVGQCKSPCADFVSCFDDSSCAPNEHCSPSTTRPQCGKECQPDYPDMTNPCDRDEQCQSGYCDPSVGQCKSPCADFVSCSDDSSCAPSEHCSLSTTRPQCGKECQPDYPDMTNPCDRDEQCQSGYCDPNVGQCKSPCADFVSCSGDSSCAPNEHCSLSATRPQCGKECQPDYPDMTNPCNRDEQCQSGYCDPNVGQCKSPCVDFVPCQGDFACALEEYCDVSPTLPTCGNECLPDRPNMSPCTRHDQCLSDFCDPVLMQCKPRDAPPPEPCCLFGFTRLGDSCYELQRSKATFDQARTQCATQFGGDLTTVPSQEVNSLLTDLLSMGNATSAWIGVTDLRTEGVFEDVTGAPQVFTQWGPGRPRNSISRNCVEVVGNGFSNAGQTLSPGAWNDLQCNKYRYFVCETSVLPICPKL